MTEAGGCPVVHFDHNSDEHSADPVGSYRDCARRRRSRGPRHMGATGSCPATRRSSRRPVTTRSSRPSATATAARACPSSSPRRRCTSTSHRDRPAQLPQVAQADQPDHRAGAVDRMKGWSSTTSPTSSTRSSSPGRPTWPSVIGVPSLVTVDWLGLDVKDWRRYASAHHAALAAVPGSEQYQHAVEVDFPYINDEDLGGHPGAARGPPGRHRQLLVQQEVDDRPVTDDEVFSIVDLLLAGGVGTTASLVSNTVVWLTRTRTCASSSSTTRRCWTRRSRSSFATSPPRRPWPGRWSRRPSSSAAR